MYIYIRSHLYLFCYRYQMVRDEIAFKSVRTRLTASSEKEKRWASRRSGAAVSIERQRYTYSALIASLFFSFFHLAFAPQLFLPAAADGPITTFSITKTWRRRSMARKRLCHCARPAWPVCVKLFWSSPTHDALAHSLYLSPGARLREKWTWGAVHARTIHTRHWASVFV